MSFCSSCCQVYKETLILINSSWARASSNFFISLLPPEHRLPSHSPYYQLHTADHSCFLSRKKRSLVLLIFFFFFSPKRVVVLDSFRTAHYTTAPFLRASHSTEAAAILADHNVPSTPITRKRSFTHEVTTPTSNFSGDGTNGDFDVNGLTYQAPSS